MHQPIYAKLVAIVAIKIGVEEVAMLVLPQSGGRERERERERGIVHTRCS